MTELVIAVLILLVVGPVILACYFGVAFARQARKAARLRSREPDEPPAR
ncbi:MAG: hypothetical protein KF761_01990 [Salinibacterium sp.]|nr:hypothetical protein [Salinibacterium sp.]